MHHYAKAEASGCGSRSAPPPSPVQSEQESLPVRSATSLHITLPSSDNPHQNGEGSYVVRDPAPPLPTIATTETNDKDIVISVNLLEELSSHPVGCTRFLRTVDLGLATPEPQPTRGGEREPPLSFSRKLSASRVVHTAHRRVGTASDPPVDVEMTRRVPRINIRGLESLENGQTLFVGIPPPRSCSARSQRTKALRTPR